MGSLSSGNSSGCKGNGFIKSDVKFSFLPLERRSLILFLIDCSMITTRLSVTLQEQKVLIVPEGKAL